MNDVAKSTFLFELIDEFEIFTKSGTLTIFRMRHWQT